MKKLLTMLLCAFAFASTAKAESRQLAETQLPRKAQEFLKRHFDREPLKLARTETTDGTYEVFLKNGAVIAFDNAGEWTDINCYKTDVPRDIVPEAIDAYVADSYGGAAVKSIDRNAEYYFVRLANGVELRFDHRFKLDSFYN